MTNLPHVVCGVIPPHILRHVADQTAHQANADARATLEHMRDLAERGCTLIEPQPPSRTAGHPGRQRTVFDAGHRQDLPGKAVMGEGDPRSSDVQVNEAFDGSGATYELFDRVFGRRSIDGQGMPLDSTVHYGTRFENAMWNGRQMVYGDGDGEVFSRFTAAVDVIGHGLTHGVIQHTAGLGYSGETGALNEHIADAFGIMVKQFAHGHSAFQSDWIIGAGILGPGIAGDGVRSLAFPGAAYDDPLLGTDPQPSHMRDYVDTFDDKGGVHINSGILNHAFYIAAMSLGGNTWEVLGRIWYAALTGRLTPDADFDDFTQATYDIAGELHGIGSRVQRVVADAWADVGLTVPLPGCASSHGRPHRRRERPASPSRSNAWRDRGASPTPGRSKGERK